MNTNENKKGRHLVRPSESELAAMYAEHTTKEIAELYNVSHYTVYNWVQHYRRNPESHELSVNIKACGRPRKRPSESELAALYAEHTATEIAAMYDVSLWTVNNWVQYYRQNPENNEINKHIKIGGPPKKRPSESELATLYAEHTAAEIAAMYDVTVGTVMNWAQFYRRNPENYEINKHIKTGGRPPKRPPESELAALYADHTAAEIAAMYDVSLWTVRKWIHFYRSNHEKSEGVVLMPDKARKRKVNNNG